MENFLVSEWRNPSSYLSGLVRDVLGLIRDLVADPLWSVKLEAQDLIIPVNQPKVKGYKGEKLKKPNLVYRREDGIALFIFREVEVTASRKIQPLVRIQDSSGLVRLKHLFPLEPTYLGIGYLHGSLYLFTDQLKICQYDLERLEYLPEIPLPAELTSKDITILVLNYTYVVIYIFCSNVDPRLGEVSSYRVINYRLGKMGRTLEKNSYFQLRLMGKYLTHLIKNVLYGELIEHPSEPTDPRNWQCSLNQSSYISSKRIARTVILSDSVLLSLDGIEFQLIDPVRRTILSQPFDSGYPKKTFYFYSRGGRGYFAFYSKRGEFTFYH